MTEQVAFVRVAGQPTGEELGELNAALEETLPEEWGVVLYTEEVEFVDVDEFERVMEDTLRQLKGEHRLDGAEPAEQPGPVDEDGDGVIPEESHE